MTVSSSISLSDVKHQPVAMEMVRQALSAGRLAHGLLLVGPEGVGKEMFAYRLAALLLCEQRKGSGVRGQGPGVELCGRCESCIAAAHEAHPDIHRVSRELSRTISELSGRKGLELYIQVIRDYVIAPAQLTSVRGRGKAFIVRDAHLMSDEAQNALLKTLEEPPPGTFIMLLTDQPHRLAETIRSRCQLVRFSALPTDFVRERLEGLTVRSRTVGSAEAAYLAARCGGRLGEAVRMADRGLFAIHEELANRLAAMQPGDALDLADWLEGQMNSLARERIEQDEALTDSLAKKEAISDLLATGSLVLADAIRAAAGHASADVPALFPDQSRRLAAGPDKQRRIEQLSAAVAGLTRADYLIAVRFINPRLALDEAAVTLAETVANSTI